MGNAPFFACCIEMENESCVKCQFTGQNAKWYYGDTERVTIYHILNQILFYVGR